MQGVLENKNGNASHGPWVCPPDAIVKRPLRVVLEARRKGEERDHRDLAIKRQNL